MINHPPSLGRGVKLIRNKGPHVRLAHMMRATKKIINCYVYQTCFTQPPKTKFMRKYSESVTYVITLLNDIFHRLVYLFLSQYFAFCDNR